MTDLLFLFIRNDKSVIERKGVYDNVDIMTKYDHVIKLRGELFEIIF